MTLERPDWLTEPCPSWCDGEHADQNHPDDRRHHSSYHVVPIIQQASSRDRTQLPGDDVEADQLNVLATRRVGARETWVAIANDQQKLELTPESARRLHAALGDLIEGIE